MAQYVRGHSLRDPCSLTGRTDHSLHRPAREWLARCLSLEQPGPWPVHTAVRAQRLQQYGRQDHLTVLVPLAVPHRDHHPVTVDVTHVKPHRFTDPEPATVQHHRDRPVLQVRDRLEQTSNLFPAQHHRVASLLARVRYMGNET